MARRLGNDSKVQVNAVCPGFIPATGLSRESSWFAQIFMKYVLALFPITRPISHGAESYLLLAENKESWHGKFISDKKVAKSSDDSYLEAEQEKLWALSEKITGKVWTK